MRKQLELTFCVLPFPIRGSRILFTCSHSIRNADSSHALLAQIVSTVLRSNSRSLKT